MKAKYSQKRRQATNKKPLILVAVAILLLAGGLAFYLKSQNGSANAPAIVNNPPEAEKIDLSPPTEAEKQQVQENKINDDKERAAAPGTTTPPSDKSAKISQASYDSAGRRLVVQTQLFGTGWQQCTLEVTQGTRKVTKTADTLYQPNFSTCMGFSVDAAEFATGGEWNVLIKASNKDGKVYSSNQEKVNIIK